MGHGRRGVTLIEQVLAMTILSVGLLAVSAAGDMLHRGSRRALRSAETVAAAAGWRERLAAAGCDGAMDGRAAEGPLEIEWRIEPLGAALVLTVRAAERGDSAGAPPGAGSAAHETTGAVRCAGR
ncbi:MAG TPA: prepilin-type N-terminal cleavage/methylation domain-containing protein [Gemmatimonadales bacterium]